MKKIPSLTVVFLFSLALNAAYAQLRMPQVNTSQTIIQEFDLGSITVKYSRPNVKGRNAFSELDKTAAVVSAKEGIEIAKAMNISKYVRLNTSVLNQATQIDIELN